MSPQPPANQGVPATQGTPARPARPRRGVVAVIHEAGRFLVIRRSQQVTAPGAICFPGGGVEAGETEEAALVRELHEEVDARGAVPRERLWTSVTPRGVQLAWWSAQLAADTRLTPNPLEVAELFWWTAEEMQGSSDLLQSNREFLAWWHAMRRQTLG